MAPIYERVQQVSDEEQSKRDLAAKDSSNCFKDSNSKSSPATHAYKSAVVRAALVTGTVAVVALALTTLCAGGFDRFVAPSPSNDGTRVKLDLGERRRVKRAQVDAPTSSSLPKYSSLTTTGQQGEPTTQSFVYTTRPIVNPGEHALNDPFLQWDCETKDMSCNNRRLHDRDSDWLCPNHGDADQQRHFFFFFFFLFAPHRTDSESDINLDGNSCSRRADEHRLLARPVGLS
jgi:hypothetical protein